jgi:NADH:ubiquinone oxidoreductase subunit D
MDFGELVGGLIIKVKMKKNFIIYSGFIYPAAHGVFRLILKLQGDTIQAYPHIGLLHRGAEKLIEYKAFIQNMSYFDVYKAFEINNNKNV